MLRPLNAFLLVLCCLLLLPACGDDKTSDNDVDDPDVLDTSDGTSDVDVAGDTGDVPDTAPDSVDTDSTDLSDVDAGPECGNGIAEGAEECDGLDRRGMNCDAVTNTNGAIGRVYCSETCTLDATECTSVTCDMGEELIGGGCVPIGIAANYVPSSTWSYVSEIDLVQKAPQPRCCTDFDNDGSLDNNLAALLNGILATGGAMIDLTEAMNQAIDDGELVLLVEYRNLPALPGTGEAVNVSLWRGIADIDGNGMPDQDAATRAAGDGVFQIDREGLRDFGSLSQFNAATLDAGVIDANWGRWEMGVVVAGAFDIVVPVEEASLRFDVRQETTGLFSNQETVMNMGLDVDVNRAEIGGIVHVADFTAFVNNMIGDCSCAGVSPGVDLLQANETDDGLRFSCNDQVTFDDTACTSDPMAGGGFICTQLTLLCGATTVLSAIPDVDTNGNGIPDAMSTGIRMKLVGATLSDPPFSAP